MPDLRIELTMQNIQTVGRFGQGYAVDGNNGIVDLDGLTGTGNAAFYVVLFIVSGIPENNDVAGLRIGNAGELLV